MARLSLLCSECAYSILSFEFYYALLPRTCAPNPSRQISPWRSNLETTRRKQPRSDIQARDRSDNYHQRRHSRIMNMLDVGANLFFFIIVPALLSPLHYNISALLFWSPAFMIDPFSPFEPISRLTCRLLSTNAAADDITWSP